MSLTDASVTTSDVKVEEFLGYSIEVLDVLQQIDLLSRARKDTTINVNSNPEALRKRLEEMINREDDKLLQDSPSSTSPKIVGNDARLCHRAFQHATLIQLYRRLYDLPSSSTPIRSAVEKVIEAIGYMVQGQYCHAWIVTLMPLFTAGCEAVSKRQQTFVRDQMGKLELCLGSCHIQNALKAVDKVWEIRAARGDKHGKLDPGQLLRKSKLCIHPLAQINADLIRGIWG